MKTYRMLQRDGRKGGLSRHFEFVVGLIESTCGVANHSVSEADQYAQQYLARNINRKVVSPYGREDQTVNQKKAALTGFLLREETNRRINQEETFGYNRETGTFEADGCLGLDLLLRAREIYQGIVGPFPDPSKFALLGDFGGGASVSLKRAEASRQQKFARGACATRGIVRLAREIVESSPIWNDTLEWPKAETFAVTPGGVCYTHDNQDLTIVSGSLLDYVDKDYSVKRIIMKEPELNGYLQKGTGSYLRGRLRRGYRHIDGICLNSSGQLNSDLACIGSRDGIYATEDAERASDSISLALCEFFNDSQWYDWLLAIRSPYTVYQLPPFNREAGTKIHRLEMMAGMGNGFCFELESIIFYSIGLACAERSALPFAEWTVSIHGDDLIVPADVHDLVRIAFERAGIVVNQEKSFGSGPFRESCGGHFYNGHSVKPFYRKGSTGLTRGDWFWLANSLLDWLTERDTTYFGSYTGKKLLEILKYVRDFSSNYDVSRWATCWTRGRRAGLWDNPREASGCSYKQRNVVDIPKPVKATDIAAYAAWLHKPVLSPTVMELLKREDLLTDPYAVVNETDERERWVRFATWSILFTGPAESPLWTLLMPPQLTPS